MSQRATKHNRLPEARPPNTSMYIVDCRGRGISAEYYVRLAGHSSDFVWLKARDIDRNLIVDFNRRKNREKRAEARRLKSAKENKSHNSIVKYFKQQEATSSVQETQSGLSSSQSNYLSQYGTKEDEKGVMKEKKVASSTRALNEAGPGLSHAATSMDSNDDLSTLDWLMCSAKAQCSAPSSSGQNREPAEELQSCELAGEQSGPEASEPGTNEMDLVRCNVCQRLRVATRESLSSICAHMHMCFDCAAGILVDMLRNDCLICNQMNSFVLNMFEVIKHLTCQLMAASSRQINPSAGSGSREESECGQRWSPAPTSSGHS